MTVKINGAFKATKPSLFPVVATHEDRVRVKNSTTPPIKPNLVPQGTLIAGCVGYAKRYDPIL